MIQILFINKTERRFRKLEEIIAKCKQVPIEAVKAKDKKKHNKSEADQNIICPVCAQSVSIKMAAKHLDRSVEMFIKTFILTGQFLCLLKTYALTGLFLYSCNGTYFNAQFLV